MNGQDEPEVNLDQLVAKVRSFFGRMRLGGGSGFFNLIIGLIAIAAVIWLVTGFY